MAEDTLLSEDLLRQLMSVGEADLLVAIPTHNNEGTIAQTIQAIEDSYQQNFVRDRVAILNVDGGSSDHTQEIVANLKRKYGNDLDTRFVVNPELLGGMRLRVGSDVWDSSVHNRLQRLQHQF